MIVTAVLPVLAVTLATAQLARPVPEPSMRLTLTATGHTFAGPPPVLPWPAEGQAVVAVDGVGTMGSSGGSVPTPTASVAKVMTAYVFLRDHPLASGSDGPTFTISAEEAARLPAREARGESHVDVVANQPFTERQALEALLIVSANNVAHEMARWDAGSGAAFVRRMNATARELGMTDTTYTDPSGTCRRMSRR
jgi:D-alanyl-D-alanine carboxypeptidase